MKTLLSFFLLATLAIGVGHAQESPITGPPPCRFLFYVESSKGMARLSSGAAATVANLVASGVSGLMRPGDSYAVWHFNQEPFQFDYPNQVWHPDQASARAAEARTYLENLRFNKPVRADLALREMFIAMTVADPLTVLLISNGESPMVGTPFDVEINKVYLRRGEELRQARLPFVTTLRCANRQIEHVAVTAGREEIVLPESAPKVASAAVVAKSSAASPAKVSALALTAPPLAPYGRPAVSSAAASALPKPGTTQTTTPLIVVRERIADVFAAPFSVPSAAAVVAPTTVAALAPRAGDAASAEKIGAPSPSDTVVVAAPALPALPELPARADGPVTVVKIIPPSTNAASAVAAPAFPGPSRAVESPLTTLRILPVRTNGEAAVLPPPQLPPTVSADPASAIAPPRVTPPTGAATGAPAKATTPFPRKSAPSFALETAGGRSAPGALATGNLSAGKAGAAAGPTVPPSTLPTLVPARPPVSAPVAANPAPTVVPRNPGKPLVPERIPEASGRIAGATNAGGKNLATVPPLINPNAPTPPIYFLYAGLVLLAVAGWFIFLIFRGSRRQSRSSISRAMDE